MPGYDYELVVREQDGEERRSSYWSAFRLQPGTKLLVDKRLVVVERTLPPVRPGAPAVALCRLPRPDEQL